MRLIPIHLIKPGQKLGQTVFNAQFQPVMRKGTFIQEGHKIWLEENGYVSVYIEDDWVLDDVCTVISEKQYLEGLKLIQKVFASAKDVLIMEEEGVHNNPHELFKKRKVRDEYMEELKIWSENMLNGLVERKVKYWTCTLVKNSNQYHLQHALSTALLAGLIGHHMKMNYKALQAMFIGSILSEFGNLSIPKAVLSKKGRLTQEEFEMVKQHCYKGYVQIKSCTELSRYIRLICLEHHERIDGSGYPNGLKGEDIDMIVQIVAIADVYDALTSDRAYRPAYAPHKALEMIRKDAGVVYDTKVYQALDTVVVPFPIGTMVSLNDGSTAVVSSFEKNDKSKPVLKVFRPDGIVEIKLYGNRYLKIMGIRHVLESYET